ncbi:hypothetical protein CVT25_000460 [Psilocybe cyanescens]|uniref:AA9 family lytic polysaccharide monooxygenase n=1 Tax=Psilocybe cyanescens TaxID=93625 RepID=A0A409VNZ4_PSICY|nr:hypothetical protein CVT25_000460 [Psilocybe cyanescens]
MPSKMKLSNSIASAFFIANSVSAHSIFQTLWVNGVSQGHIVGIRVPDYDGPIMDVTSNDLICNGGINPYHQPISTAIIPVPAGAQVTAEWHHTLTSAGTGDAADPIDPSHKGPILAYLAKVNNATQSSVTGLNWFKIYHDGLDSSGSWAVDKLIANQGKVSFTIPSCIAPGQYLLRVELIALHGAETYPGAQLYVRYSKFNMECAQIQITGGGSASPTTVSFPGAYKGSDPGITTNIYSGLKTYTIPGPPVFSCSGSGNSAPVPSSTAATPTITSTSKPSPTTVSSTPSSTSGATVAQYGQCGGLTYSGATICASPFTCVKSSDYALSVNGVDQGHGVGVRVPTSNSAITDLTSNNIICNTNFIQPVSTAVIPVNAGDKLTAQFHRTSAGYLGPDPSDPIDPTNKGPILAYLAEIPSATQSTVTGLKWFKIGQIGYNATNGQWGSDVLFINGGNATFTVPSCIVSGQYLFRAEAIALQSATSYPGAQFYMSCAQISVTGSSSPKTPATVSFPGAYTASSPGIVTSLFGLSSYTPPGTVSR